MEGFNLYAEKTKIISPNHPAKFRCRDIQRHHEVGKGQTKIHGSSIQRIEATEEKKAPGQEETRRGCYINGTEVGDGISNRRIFIVRSRASSTIIQICPIVDWPSSFLSFMPSTLR
jgi:hypothetical protein